MISRRAVITSAVGVGAVAALSACAAEQPDLVSAVESPSSAPKTSSPSPSASPTASATASASPSPSATASPSASATKSPSASPETKKEEEKQEAVDESGLIEVCRTSDIPVGSGRKFNVEGFDILITQPRSGTFRAFSAVCTHAGYVMNNVSNAEIKCDSHGSVFSADNGSVITGPASRALGKIEVQVISNRVLVSF